MDPDDYTHAETMNLLLVRFQKGDQTAKNELLRFVENRLLSLTRQMKRDFGKVQRWEQTEDVYQGAIIRLNQALEKTEINDLQHFLRLAALQIRRELIDLSRKHRGAGGFAGNHESRIINRDDDGSQAAPANFNPADLTNDPAVLQEWSELHELIDQLPEEQRNVVDLLLYHGMSQNEAAEIMGTSVRSIKRYWRNARLNLYDRLEGT